MAGFYSPCRETPQNAGKDYEIYDIGFFVKGCYFSSICFCKKISMWFCVFFLCGVFLLPLLRKCGCFF
jgi:hypothetical protein